MNGDFGSDVGSFTAMDVAEYILQEMGPVTAMTLQKLVYYCQAWSLVWDEGPLYNDEIQAWANGPVIRSLYDRHNGKFLVYPGMLGGNPGQLNETARQTIDSVIEYYGGHTAQWLSDLTHAEDPWKEARKGLDAAAASDAVITLESMHRYYSGLLPNEQ